MDFTTIGTLNSYVQQKNLKFEKKDRTDYSQFFRQFEIGSESGK